MSMTADHAQPSLPRGWPVSFPHTRPFDGIGAEGLRALLTVARWQIGFAYRQSRTITSLCGKESTDHAICIVATGGVEVVVSGKAPRRAFVMERLESGDFFELGRFPYLDRDAVLRATSKAYVIGFDDSFYDCVAQHPKLASWAARWASGGRVRQSVRTRDVALLDVRDSVLADLRRIGTTSHTTSGAGRLVARTTQQEIAERIGSCRETVSRAIAELIDAGTVERRRHGVYYVTAS